MWLLYRERAKVVTFVSKQIQVLKETEMLRTKENKGIDKEASTLIEQISECKLWRGCQEEKKEALNVDLNPIRRVVVVVNANKRKGKTVMSKHDSFLNDVEM